MNLLVGNIVAFCASLLMVYAGLIKKPKKVILVQSIQIGLLSLSNLILGGISGCLINAVSFIRNIICYKKLYTFSIKVIIALLSVLLTIKFNNQGLFGFIPLISTLPYVFLIDIKDPKKFKYLNIYCMSTWTIYDFTIKSYASIPFDIGCILTNIYSVYLLKR